MHDVQIRDSRSLQRPSRCLKRLSTESVTVLVEATLHGCLQCMNSGQSSPYAKCVRICIYRTFPRVLGESERYDAVELGLNLP